MRFSLALALLMLPGAVAAQVPAMTDTQGKTLSGVAYTQPKAWTVARDGGVTTFVAPERDLSIAVVDIGSAPNAQEATAKAWMMFKPNAKRMVRLSSPGTPGTSSSRAASATKSRSAWMRSGVSRCAWR